MTVFHTKTIKKNILLLFIFLSVTIIYDILLCYKMKYEMKSDHDAINMNYDVRSERSDTEYKHEQTTNLYLLF